MTQKELEIAQAACCVGTIWDQYEGTEEFNEMVGKRVQHLIKLVRNHLEQPVEGLNEEIENYFGNIPDDMDKIDIARHFAEWGAEHLKK